MSMLVEELPAPDPAEWDVEALACGGSFLHCHAFAVYEAAQVGARPLFFRLRDSSGGFLGVATGMLSTPRNWPLSRYCREAQIHTLPAVRQEAGLTLPESLAAIEGALRHAGVFRLRVGSAGSTNSGETLAALGYRLCDRCEFYLHLDRPLDAIWSGMKPERRNKVRKAQKAGVKTRRMSDRAGLRILWDLHSQTMSRRKIVTAGDPLRHLDLAYELLLRRGRASVLVSEHEGAAVGALLYGAFGPWACTLLSGSTDKGNQLGAPSQLRWDLIEQLHSRGIQILSLGGMALGPGQDTTSSGLYRFKKDFGAAEIFQPTGVKTMSQSGAALDRVRTLIKSMRWLSFANVTSAHCW